MPGTADAYPSAPFAAFGITARESEAMREHFSASPRPMAVEIRAQENDHVSKIRFRIRTHRPGGTAWRWTGLDRFELPWRRRREMHLQMHRPGDEAGLQLWPALHMQPAEVLGQVERRPRPLTVAGSERRDIRRQSAARQRQFDLARRLGRPEAGLTGLPRQDRLSGRSRHPEWKDVMSAKAKAYAAFAIAAQLGLGPSQAGPLSMAALKHHEADRPLLAQVRRDGTRGGSSSLAATGAGRSLARARAGVKNRAGSSPRPGRQGGHMTVLER
jgi:hypothetical protein